MFHEIYDRVLASKLLVLQVNNHDVIYVVYKGEKLNILLLYALASSLE
jgi:hypothetical protein